MNANEPPVPLVAIWCVDNKAMSDKRPTVVVVADQGDGWAIYRMAIRLTVISLTAIILRRGPFAKWEKTNRQVALTRRSVPSWAKGIRVQRKS